MASVIVEDVDDAKAMERVQPTFQAGSVATPEQPSTPAAMAQPRYKLLLKASRGVGPGAPDPLLEANLPNVTA